MFIVKRLCQVSVMPCWKVTVAPNGGAKKKRKPTFYGHTFRHSGARTWGSNKAEISQGGTRTETNEPEAVKTDGWTTKPGEVSHMSVVTDKLLFPPRTETGDLSTSTIFLHQAYLRVGEGLRNSYQTPKLFSPYWPIDSAYGTRSTFNTASSCPEDSQTRVTDERPVVSFANDDVVIPPSETVDPAKIEDKDTAEEMHCDASNDFTTASSTYHASADVRPDRRMLPRRRGMLWKPVDGKIAIGAHSDGLPIESSIKARGDRRISGGVSSRIERAEFPPDCSFCLTDQRPHVLRRPPQKSTSRNHSSTESQDKHNQTTTAYFSNRKPRTFRQSRTPIRTEKKAKKSDLSPRTVKRGVSPRSERSAAGRSRIDSAKKTVKKGKHVNSHRQRPFTADISPRRPDDSKSYLTYRHKVGFALPSYDEETEEGTDSDSIIKSLRQERKRSPLRT